MGCLIINLIGIDMKKSIVFGVLLSSLITLSGCGGSAKQLTQAECQQQYDTAKNSALDVYEGCSRTNCNGQVIMTQGQDPCTESCFEVLKSARATLDATLADCLANAAATESTSAPAAVESAPVPAEPVAVEPAPAEPAAVEPAPAPAPTEAVTE